jgi:hypothetical protein
VADTTYLRLVSSQESLPPDSPSRWANEPLSLRAVAVALEHLVGPGPDPYAGASPELDGWVERHRRAAAMLAEVANMDAGLLRSLAGPPHDDDGPRPVGTGLLVTAANSIGRGWRR